MAKVPFMRFTQFVDRMIKVNEVGQPFKLCPHQRVIFESADQLRNFWNTFIYSTIKESGKTTLQAMHAIKWALEHDDDLLILQANDFDQGVSRVFGSMSKLCERNKIQCKILADSILFPNGSLAKVAALDPYGESGSNHGFHGVDEVWGIISEAGLRLVEELTPRLNKPSIRWVSTYAGWTGQSKLLWGWYVDAVGTREYSGGRAQFVPNSMNLPLYLNKDAGTFCYWDSGVEARRMPWQQGPKAAAYYKQKQRSERAGTYSRLFLNAWGSGDDKFITQEMWDSIVDDELIPIVSGGSYWFAGWDASTKRDSTAVVFVAWDGNKVRVVNHKIFKPGFLKPVDFEAVENYVRDIQAKNHIVKIFADPHQLFSTIQKMQKEGFPVEEYAQTLPNLTMMASNLFDAFNNKTLRTYQAEDLKAHALNAIASESPRGYVIKKEKSAGKIDALVALGMALTAATVQGPSSCIQPWSAGNRTMRMDRDWTDQPGYSQPNVDLHRADRLMGGGRGRIRFDW